MATSVFLVTTLGTDLYHEMCMKIDELTYSGPDTLSVADHLQDDGDSLQRRRRSHPVVVRLVTNTTPLG